MRTWLSGARASSTTRGTTKKAFILQLYTILLFILCVVPGYP
jgi:hypothetical protein